MTDSIVRGYIGEALAKGVLEKRSYSQLRGLDYDLVVMSPEAWAYITEAHGIDGPDVTALCSRPDTRRLYGMDVALVAGWPLHRIHVTTTRPARYNPTPVDYWRPRA